tara:strand:- start:65 stop:442 length:378 start_codon:yes stop_codon:yes gene_type:complete
MINPMLNSILFNKCPKCGKGDFFIRRNPYLNIILQKGDYHKNCSFCNCKFELEPGLFYGAMYVSYALAVGLGCFLLIFLLSTLGKEKFSLIILIIGLSILIFFPLNYYLSRLIWLNLFIKKSSKP